MAAENSTAINASSNSTMLDDEPPDCQLLKHKVDEDPRWNYGKTTRILSFLFTVITALDILEIPDPFPNPSVVPSSSSLFLLQYLTRIACTQRFP